MKKLKGRFIDDIGRVIMLPEGLTDFIVDGKDIGGMLAIDDEETRLFNQFSDTKLNLYDEAEQNITKEEYDEKSANVWFTPQEFQLSDEDLTIWLFSQCNTDEEEQRVLLELNMYKERDLYPLLNHLRFLIDHFRKNDVVWGCGRGSSVSSFVLFLLGVHKINALKFDLNINEFLR